MLQQVVSEFAPMLGERDLTCALELPPSLEYDCDPDKLARVFDNLLRNACHYSTPGSVVRHLRRGGGGFHCPQVPQLRADHPPGEAGAHL